MNKNRKILWAELTIIIVLLLAILLPQLIGTAETATTEKGSIKYASDLEDKTFVTIAGAVYEHEIKKIFDNPDIIYVQTTPDMAMSVIQGKADALLLEESAVEILLDEYEELSVLPCPVGTASNCFAFVKNEEGKKLRDEFNAFLAQAQTDGLLKEMKERWEGDNPPAAASPCTSDGRNGEISIVTSYDWQPYIYLTDEGPAGLFIDLLYRFCENNGYKPVISNTDSGTALGGFEAAKYQMLAYGVTYTDERAEKMYFSDEIVGEYEYLMVRRSDLAQDVEVGPLVDLNSSAITIAAVSGTEYPNIAMKEYPNANIVLCQNLADVCAAVESGKADYGISYIDALMENEKLYTMYFPLFKTLPEGIAFQKSEAGKFLCDEYNSFIESIQADGKYEEYRKKWILEDSSSKLPEERTYTAENGKLEIYTSGSWFPYTFYNGDKLSGFLIELVCEFCKENGYEPVFSVTTLESGITGLNSGKYQIFCDGVAASDEKEETLYISTEFSRAYTYFFSKYQSASGSTESKAAAFLSGLISSFEKNFIRENRWKMIASGLGVTLLIAVLSALSGTLLGAIICALRMSRNPFMTGFARIYVKIIQGTPIVVLLMLLYYIVFAKINLSAVGVAVIGFSLDFAAYTSEIFRSGIETVPSGQMKAALALGFKPGKAFFKVVLPQALRQILPVYRGQFISLVKTTAVAGYITVQDLTKVSDIIRSRTYEAFFPLITTALIYFGIAELLAVVLKLIESHQDPMKRPRLPKGVKKNAAQS